MIAIDVNNLELLFKRISGDDEQAFRVFFDLYKKELFSVAFKLTKSSGIAEEIIQEVFISLWVSRKKLDKVEQPLSYIYRTLLNKVSHYLKKEANQDHILKAALQYSQPFSNFTEELLNAKDCQKMIENALEQLPKQQKIVFILSRQQGLSNFEIAQQLNISPHTVKTHLSKATAFIKVYLKDAAQVAICLSFIGNLIHR